MSRNDSPTGVMKFALSSVSGRAFNNCHDVRSAYTNGVRFTSRSTARSVSHVATGTPMNSTTAETSSTALPEKSPGRSPGDCVGCIA